MSCQFLPAQPLAQRARCPVDPEARLLADRWVVEPESCLALYSIRNKGRERDRESKGHCVCFLVSRNFCLVIRFDLARDGRTRKWKRCLEPQVAREQKPGLGVGGGDAYLRLAGRLLKPQRQVPFHTGYL